VANRAAPRTNPIRRKQAQKARNVFMAMKGYT
jgi:hypothetical protein